MLQNLYQCNEELFSKKVFNPNEVIAHYLKDISLPKLTKEQIEQCEGEITEPNAVKDVLGNMVFNKIPRKRWSYQQNLQIFYLFSLSSKLLCYCSIKNYFVWRIKHFSKTSSYQAC